MAVRQAVSEASRSKPSDQAASNANPAKVAAVAELTDQFRSSSATVLTEYRGLSVAQLKQLRRQLGSGTAYTVTTSMGPGIPIDPSVSRVAQDAPAAG